MESCTAWQHVVVSFKKRSAAIHAVVHHIHQRMDDVGARGANESNSLETVNAIQQAH
jgi:hypothetical protein